MRFGSGGGFGGNIEKRRCRGGASFFYVITNGRQWEMVSGRAGLRRGILLGLREPAKTIVAERDARGRGYRSGQGLRRGIQLRFREMAKSIAAGPELAVGSDS